MSDLKPASSSLSDYMRLARMQLWPVGSILVFWPVAWGYLLGQKDIGIDLVRVAAHLGVFLFGSTLLHSAGCVINDIQDKDLDAQVERTKDRPLPSGRVSISAAWTFYALLVASFFTLLAYFEVPRVVAALSVVGVFGLHAQYPLAKRYTWMPQVFLGFAMSWGATFGWLLVAPDELYSIPMWVLTAGNICWPIFYDTIYACPDRKDDAKAGINSAALLFGDHVKPAITAFAAAFVASLAYVGVATGQGTIYHVVSVGGAAAHLGWQLLILDVDNAESCATCFFSNGNLGYIVTAGIMLQKLCV